MPSKRNFADKYDIKNYFCCRAMGIEHALLPEQGVVGPAMLLLARGFTSLVPMAL